MKESSEIPSDPDKFKAWADRECPKWPTELMAMAVDSWHAKLDHAGYAKSCITKFEEAFAQWSAKQ